MDILDKIKKFINESIQSLFVNQKEDLSIIIHKEVLSAVSEMKTFASQQVQTNERDMANMQQTVFALNQGMENLLKRIDAIQQSIDKLKERHAELLSTESQVQPTPSKPLITTYYAKMVDSMSPLGFKIDNLKSTEDGCAFKITIDNDLKGSYEIVEDREIQQEVLAAFNPLISDSSIYDFVPQNPTGISIVLPGTVVKENHVLRIVNKQKIEIN
jgi:vacuolar-type H+-ATPase subunit I/STV1